MDGQLRDSNSPACRYTDSFWYCRVPSPPRSRPVAIALSACKMHALRRILGSRLENVKHLHLFNVVISFLEFTLQFRRCQAQSPARASSRPPGFRVTSTAVPACRTRNRARIHMDWHWVPRTATAGGSRGRACPSPSAVPESCATRPPAPCACQWGVVKFLAP